MKKHNFVSYSTFFDENVASSYFCVRTDVSVRFSKNTFIYLIFIYFGCFLSARICLLQFWWTFLWIKYQPNHKLKAPVFSNHVFGLKRPQPIYSVGLFLFFMTKVVHRSMRGTCIHIKSWGPSNALCRVCAKSSSRNNLHRMPTT